MTADQSRISTLSEGPGAIVRLAWYPPGLRMEAHAHEVAQASWLLMGGLSEHHGSREYISRRPMAGFKPAGQAHANAYGPAGALILSLNLDAAAAPDFDWSWGPAAPDSLALARRLLTAGDGERDEVAGDLVASLHAPRDRRRATPPAWVERCREALEDDPEGWSIARLARAHGVHRVHLSRSFRDHYGVAPSVFRRRIMAGRALRSLLDGAPRHAAAAAEAGFADEAHFSRTMKSELGVGPRALRTLLH
ncbi:helix-turn-helix domain-containing protein [Marinicauda salina]|uniref:helix-turn-helix domain-containing protein n=1 Tax=Marinicauda salina TaxID=2135793 RepID=UPI001304FC26|nr:AraC family transcriptional regulator [Marinicauda salina]